jgi:hypothetical protein
VTYTYADEPAVPPVKVDRSRLYPLPEGDGRPGYAVYLRDSDRAFFITDTETYLRLTEECRVALEEVFGEGSVGGFVWPYGEQKNAELIRRLSEAGYYGLRKTGETRDKDNFASPRDRMHWSYNANHQSLLEVAAMYESAASTDELQFFCFGVHSVDFENAGNWDELMEFARRYGNRPDTYYYASVGEIFAYEDAVKALTVTAEKIENPSSVDVYLLVDGAPLCVPAASSIALG